MKHLVTLFVAAVAALAVTPAYSEMYATGQITSFEILPEHIDQANAFHNQLSVRIEGLCIDSGPGDSYDPSIAVQNDGSIIIRSGRMDGLFAHNAANFQNTFNLLITALNEGHQVLIGGLPECDAGDGKTVELWKSRISISTNR